jgi:thiol-disulfide isomerase/thioredoxin
MLAASLCVSSGARAADLEDLLFDLQIIPLGGQDPPAFTLESLDGKKVSLSDYRGKPVFLYFWASW